MEVEKVREPRGGKYIYTHAHTDDTPVVKIGLLAQRIVSRLITNYLRNEQLNTGWQRAN